MRTLRCRICTSKHTPPPARVSKKAPLALVREFLTVGALRRTSGGQVHGGRMVVFARADWYFSGIRPAAKAPHLSRQARRRAKSGDAFPPSEEI